MDDDNHLILNLVSLSNQNLVKTGLMLFKKACDFQGSVSGNSFEIGQISDDIEKFLLFFGLVLVHDEFVVLGI